MCVFMEIILKVIRNPINMEININMGGEIVPMYDQKKCIRNQEFQRETYIWTIQDL